MSTTRHRTTIDAFATQAREHLESMSALFEAQHPPASDVLKHATGATRSLRGNASLLGLDSCQGFLGRLFHLLADVDSNEVPWSNRLLSILKEAAEVEEIYVETLERGDSNPKVDALTRVETLMASWKRQEHNRQEDLGASRDNSQRPESQSASPADLQSTLQTLVGTVEKLRESAQKKPLARAVKESFEDLHEQLIALQSTVASVAAQIDKLPDDSESGLRNHCEGGLSHLVESAAQEVLDEARECGVSLSVRATGSLDIDEDEFGGAIIEVLRNLWSDSLRAQASSGRASIDTVVRVEEEKLLVEVRDAGIDRQRRNTASKDDDVLSRYPALRRLRPLLESIQGMVDVEPSRIEGCRFRVHLPRTRQGLVARVLRVGTHELAIPASAIDSVHDFGSVQVSQDDSGALVEVNGRTIPLVHLAVLRSDPSYDELVRQFVVIVGSFERRAALFASGPLRTVRGQCEPESPLDWLSTLQCGDNSVELLDPCALLGRRKSARTRGAAVRGKVDAEASESPLFVVREEQAEKPKVTTRTVLVVNSSEVEGTTLSHSLKGASFRAITARTGTEALKILATEPIDLMVCDLRLPEMNAQQISEHRKRSGEYATVPLLLVLSHVGDQGHLVAQQLGAADFVSSPIEQDEFVMVVKRLTDVS